MDKFKDECGVFGIFGHPEAANMTYLGLYALSIADGRARACRVGRPASPRLEGDGLRGHVFNGEVLSHLPGSMAIAIRYSTAGESKLSNAQPILIECAHG